jgi:sigma-B regulation protein RsbU (phosphoserine phosphatase)
MPDTAQNTSSATGATAATPPGAGASSADTGMRSLDLSTSTNVPVLMEMVGALSRVQHPNEVLHIFREGWKRLNQRHGYISVSVRGLEPGQYRITRMMLDFDDDSFEVTDPWANRDTIEVHEGGFIGELIRSAYPEVIYDLDVPDDPVLGDVLRPFRSLMAIPLFDNGEPLNWGIMIRHEPEGFSIEELEETILRGNLIGGTVRNKLLERELRAANEKIQAEVDQIASIQRALLPDPIPEIAGLTISAAYETYDIAGGDYYDLVPLSFRSDGTPDPEGRWGILIADASGHGPAAAVVMAMLHSILHAHPTEPNGPAEVLQHANRHLCNKRIEHSFVTAFFGVYDPTTRNFTYACAGHNPPLLKDSGEGGRVQRLDSVGELPLGIVYDVQYREATIQLEPEQTVLLYTDGITESMNPEGVMFGTEGVEAALTRCTGDPDCVQGSLLTALRAHESGVRPSDDQTFLAFRVH